MARVLVAPTAWDRLAALIRTHSLPIERVEDAKRGIAQPDCLLEHRVEHRGEVARRGIDDLQYLGGRSLLLQRLARLRD